MSDHTPEPDAGPIQWTETTRPAGWYKPQSPPPMPPGGCYARPAPEGWHTRPGMVTPSGPPAPIQYRGQLDTWYHRYRIRPSAMPAVDCYAQAPGLTVWDEASQAHVLTGQPPARVGPVRRIHRAMRAWWMSSFEPACTITVPAGRLPAWVCNSLTWLVNEVVLPAAVVAGTLAVFWPLTARNAPVWAPLNVAAMLGAYKALMFDIRPTRR